MNDSLLLLLFVIGWFVLQRVVLPKLGVPT
jgi:p-aminobenzoyl-glutamate transporter AbgT